MRMRACAHVCGVLLRDPVCADGGVHSTLSLMLGEVEGVPKRVLLLLSSEVVAEAVINGVRCNAAM